MRQLFLRSTVSFIVAFGLTLSAEGEIIINVPPDRAPTSIGSDTVLNVLDGGTIAYLFNANSGSTVNVSGGTVGSRFYGQQRLDGEHYRGHGASPI